MDLDPDDLYGIETREDDRGLTTDYRWYSRYNGARGRWVPRKSRAHAKGRRHGKIILKLEVDGE